MSMIRELKKEYPKIGNLHVNISIKPPFIMFDNPVLKVYYYRDLTQIYFGGSYEPYNKSVLNFIHINFDGEIIRELD